MRATPVLRERRPALAVFASRPFRRLWVASALSLLGDSFSYIAMAWLVLQLTGSSLALGSVLVAQALPRAPLMLVGGAMADRLTPRLTMLGSMGLRVALVAPLAVTVLTGTVRMWEVYVVAVVFGVVDAFFIPARSSILPKLVRDEHLEPGNAVLTVTTQASYIVGPALAGVVVAAFGTGWAFAGDAACFAVGSIFVVLLPRSAGGSAAAAGASSGKLRDEITAGLRYAWGDVGIRAAHLFIASVDFAANGALGVGLPVLAHSRFGAGSVGLGVLLGAWGIGATVGAAGAGFVRAPRRFGRLVVAVSAWIGTGVVIVGIVPSLVPAALTLGVAALATGAVNTYGVSWMQRRTDPAMQGRVMSLVMLASVGLTPIAYALSGAIADASATLLFALCGGIMLATAGIGVASRTVRAM
ncbi:MAG TPA: MFS transporter [Patescibacteria group bacterium]|nr:MFS transporter [Patescibacteria group bacterium]